jgi:hypothetical protein
MLFVLIDNLNGVIEAAWLVPSVDFDLLHGQPTTRGTFRFSASTKDDTRDKWSPFRLTASELPSKIMSRLEEMGRS